MADETLAGRLKKNAGETRRPDGLSVATVSMATIKDAALAFGVPVREVEVAAVENGLVPLRYLRNQDAIPSERQSELLRARVLLVGLGGLGGSILEHLARTGVGRIVAADGDRFDETNLNRQLLATVDSVETMKIEAARARVAQVNPAVEFVGIAAFLVGTDFVDRCRAADLVIDALGGLKDRLALHRAAAAAGKVLVTAAVAGWTGYVGVVPPGAAGPADFFDAAEPGAEDSLGTPSPVVALAASFAAAQAVRVLCGVAGTESAVFFFDLENDYFEKVSL